MASKDIIKVIIKYTGSLAVLLSFYYIFNVFKANEIHITSLQVNSRTVVIIALCAVFYGVSQFLLSETWRQLLESFTGASVDRKKCYKLYGQTQITKYLPGNIFHFVGRQIRGKELGFSHITLIGATLFESLGLVIVAGTISILGSFVFGFNQEKLSLLTLSGIVILSITVIAGLVFYLPKLTDSAGIGKIQHGIGSIVRILKTVVVYYGLYFLVSGSVLIALVVNFTGTITPADYGIVLVVCVFSWIAGFVTPGAPAGIGIREALLILLLTPVAGGTAAAISALLYRVITVAGDVVFYLLARAIRVSNSKLD